MKILRLFKLLPLIRKATGGDSLAGAFFFFRSKQVINMTLYCKEDIAIGDMYHSYQNFHIVPEVIWLFLFLLLLFSCHVDVFIFLVLWGFFPALSLVKYRTAIFRKKFKDNRTYIILIFKVQGFTSCTIVWFYVTFLSKF